MTKKHFISGLLLLALPLLSACTPPDVDYCRSFGVEGTSEYSKCLNYYHTQDALFDADYDRCSAQADLTYPTTLYDHGSTARVSGTFGPHGEYYPSRTIEVEPDYRHNAEVDRLRSRIIEPCMYQAGWNSPSDWQAGRHAVLAQPATRPVQSQKLPWQR